MERNRYTKRLCLIGVIFFLVVTSCASQGGWAGKRLADSQIEPGMTKEMVRAALGKPGMEVVKEGETLWEYNGYRYTAAYGIVITHSYFVYFRDGKVTRTTGDPNRIGYR